MNITKSVAGRKLKMGHDHGKISASKVFWVLLLNLGVSAAQIIGGLLSGSLSLISDAVHNLSDTFSIAITYFASLISGKQKDSRKTYGYKRAEIIAAFVNASALVLISVFLIYEALKRFRHPEVIDGNVMIILALLGIAVNFGSAVLLKKDADHSMNIMTGYLHMLGDMLASVAVLIGGSAVRFFGAFWIDPAVTVLISLYLIKESWNILKASVDILMQSSAELDYPSIKSNIEKIPGVKNIHHAHTWLSDERTIYFEAHIDMDDCMLSQACAVSQKIEGLLKNTYGIHHSTLQFETGRCEDKEFFKA